LTTLFVDGYLSLKKWIKCVGEIVRVVYRLTCAPMDKPTAFR